MNIKSIKAHHFNEFRRRERTDLDNSGSRRWDDDFKKHYYAFTCMEYSEAAGKLFCGTTNMSLEAVGSVILFAFMAKLVQVAACFCCEERYCSETLLVA